MGKPALRWMIPSDWQEDRDGYVLVFFCLPNSRQWRGLITGIIDSLSFGWSWNGKTGRVKDVQAIGREIFESMAICKMEDILAEFQRLNAILAGESVTIGENVYDYTMTGIAPILNNLDLAVTVSPAQPVITVSPAQPVITVSPAQPVITVSPAQPVITVSPAQPVITVSPAQPVITVEPSPLAVIVDMTGTNTALGRIASSVENIDEKTETLITWDEMIERVSDVFGVGHGAYVLLNSLSGLVPDIKLNPTQLINSIMELVFWKSKVLLALTAHNAFMAAIAGSQAGQATIAGIQAATGIFDSASDLMKNWKDVLFGNATYFDMFNSVWEWLFGEEPPEDPYLAKLEEIRLVLESRGIDNRDVLNAIEDVLGGTYEPPAQAQ